MWTRNGGFVFVVVLIVGVLLLVHIFTSFVSMSLLRPRGLMDKASVFGTEDCRFESYRGHIGKVREYFFFLHCRMSQTFT